MDPTFLVRKKPLTNENSAKNRFYEKIRNWKTGLIDQANGRELAADFNAGPFKGRFPLVC